MITDRINFQNLMQSWLLIIAVYTELFTLPQSIFEWVEVFYNRQRLHSALQYLPPSLFEKQWCENFGVSLPSVH